MAYFVPRVHKLLTLGNSLNISHTHYLPLQGLLQPWAHGGHLVNSEIILNVLCINRDSM